MYSINHQDFKNVQKVVEHYFLGLHKADTDLLSSIFDADVILMAPGVRRSLTQWLKLVQTRATPAQQGDTFSFKILSIEIYDQQAMVKVECPLLQHQYIDYLGLIKENDRWTIVSKMYAEYQYQ